jgi:predicted O-methyltransferase YrrM
MAFIRRLREAYRLSRSPNFRFFDYPPGHFYSPIPDAAAIEARSAVVFDRSARSLPGIDLNEAAQLALLEEFGAFCAEMPFPETPQPARRYYFDNPFFGDGDALALYSIMRRFRPKRIIEVGSGFSSAAMLDVSECFLDNSVDFTFIEPFPERLMGLLRDTDRDRYEVLEAPVQEVDQTVFNTLESGDILFIDSSHVAKIDSDTLHLAFSVLPALKPGVLVHIHDVLWPFEYPKQWLDEGRAWNEAYLVRAFLMYNRLFEMVFFNSFIAAHHRHLLERYMPLAVRNPESGTTIGNSSLWLRKAA